jgi:hypothetical protein
MALTDHDLHMHARSGIMPGLAEAGGPYRVTSAEGVVIIGRSGNDDYSRMAIPYTWPGKSGTSECELR